MGLLDSAGSINQDILAGTMLVVGLFVTFFGARFFKHIIFFVGFLIGGFLTYYSVPIIWSWFDAKVQDDTLLYMSLTVGALCGVLLVVVYKAAVFSCGAICGAIFSQILWIAVVANVDTEGKDWMPGVQIGVLVVFAGLGGWLAFKFVEQVLKAITAFVGGFMFASGIAYFIGRIDKKNDTNVIDWVIFFGSYKNYTNLEDVCDVYCIVCILLWLVMFAAGCFVQYKLHKKHKRKDHDDDDESDSDYSSSEEDSDRSYKSGKGRKKKRRDSDEDSSSDDSESEESRKSKRRRKKKNRPAAPQNDYNEPAGSQYGGYAGSQYGGSVRQSQRFPQSVQSHSEYHEGPAPGSSYRSQQRLGPSQGQGPQIAMSEYGANYARGASQPRQSDPGYARSAQYENYGNRHAVQYV
eukprot:CAMPEP_0201572522 /NCGR_PEP_ID=MMETSP0190_2-20130828/15838_1 /ASSEMBLY_ACC=CAM_ASM_000263 /TAXON_ID=37353 /ORGANISM="Rosalina sp." /LENGTH=407 /DNA_ID=CAMNT_0047998383 /DNA_START=148 /DNA_END=1371 /DNA_ORIENTATION=+